jgi:hypothetical protein
MKAQPAVLTHRDRTRFRAPCAELDDSSSNSRFGKKRLYAVKDESTIGRPCHPVRTRIGYAPPTRVLPDAVRRSEVH